MIVRKLELKNFRAHEHSVLEFGSGINIVTGSNGAGKTNLLEAIHYLCLTKSFLTSNDRYVVRNGCDYFDIKADFLEAEHHSNKEGRIETTAIPSGRRIDETSVRLTCVPREGKKLFVNDAPLERMTEMVGRFPIVIHSPDDYVLTSDGPDQRRRFLNNVLSQARPVYLADLMKYRRIIKQRNALLSKRSQLHLLDAWTAELVQTGARIILARRLFVNAFGVFLADAYRQLADVVEEPTMHYRTVDRETPGTTVDEIADVMQGKVDELRQQEIERGRTLVGPHHDELVFKLNGLDVRRYGSQGQHRTFAMALKIGQYFYLQDRLDARPVMLLDDAFAHLDERRTEGFLELLRSDAIGQTIITAASDHYFENLVFENGVESVETGNRSFRVDSGVVREALNA